jgi:hypothetical protein
MDRAKVQEVKRVARKMDYHPTTQTIHALADTCLELMDKVDGGVDQKAIERGYQERERQLKLALVDIRVEVATIQENIPGDLEPAVVEGEPLLRDLSKVTYMLDLAQQMLRAKGPTWTREWAYYTPRIAEEFGD